MSLREYLRSNEDQIETPAYYFDLDAFEERARLVAKEFPEIPLTFSIKANPFLLEKIPDVIQHVEVCSPGELSICKKYNIPGKRIIYSGVNKGIADITEAIAYGVDIATAESLLHMELEQKAASQMGVTQKVILRYISGNQFGMSQEDILDILANAQKYSNLDIYGIHYYSGTQKKLRQIDKDIAKITQLLETAKEKFDFIPKLVEFGPGLQVNYFHQPYDESEDEYLKELAGVIVPFARKYPVGIEMGRFFAASCGTYATKVSDIKKNAEVNYVICDGGIHQLRYYGQTMAMQVPEMEVLQAESEASKQYCICGSLCTVADVLVREVTLPRLGIGSLLLFHRCGAYSITEGSALFLSRQIPAVYLYDQEDGLRKVRKMIDASDINSQEC